MEITTAGAVGARVVVVGAGGLVVGRRVEVVDAVVVVEAVVGGRGEVVELVRLAGGAPPHPATSATTAEQATVRRRR